MASVSIESGLWFAAEVKGGLGLAARHQVERLLPEAVHGRHRTRRVGIGPQAVELFRQGPAGLQAVQGQSPGSRNSSLTLSPRNGS